MNTRVVLVAAVIVASGLAGHAQSPTDWPAVAGDLGATKYSPIDQITTANVTKLTQAWTYQPGGPAPIVIGNLLYFAAAGNVVALNATTGAEVWRFALSQATT